MVNKIENTFFFKQGCQKDSKPILIGMNFKLHVENGLFHMMKIRDQQIWPASTGLNIGEPEFRD